MASPTRLCIRLAIIIMLLLLIGSIIFLILQVLYNNSASDTRARLIAELDALETNVSASGQQSNTNAQSIQQSQTEISILRSQLVELEMSAANTTTLQVGTFVWSFGTGIPAFTCSIFWDDWQFTTPGTGYNVNDLIVLPSFTIVEITASPVFQVTSVGANGTVLTFNVLTVGCADNNYGAPQGPFVTLSPTGTGVTVTATSTTIVVPPNNAYYNFPTPMGGVIAPLQQSQYRLKSMQIESAQFIILELDPPAIPIEFIAAAGGFKIGMIAYAWDLDILAIRATASLGSIYPLTAHNRNALALTDTTNCFASSYCYFEAYDSPFEDTKNAVRYVQQLRVGPSIQYDKYVDYIQWFWDSTDGAFNYLGNNAKFTLNYPLMLVLPST